MPKGKTPKSKAQTNKIYPLCEFLNDLGDDRKTNTPDKYCFVLGSGASLPSGIMSGHGLVTIWLKELYLRSHPRETLADTTEEKVSAWATAEKLGIKGFNFAKRASFYGQVYKRRFQSNRKLGQEYLRHVISGKKPSLGYSVLAKILTKTVHSYVITTNFDHLTEEAVQRYAGIEPHVVGIESLAEYIGTQQQRPTIAKIHGDIFLKTYNADEDIKKLREQWETPLRTILKNYIPIFIGYGGNDPGFMEFLLNEKSKDWLPNGFVWTYRPKSGLPTNDLIRNFISKHDGRFVPIPGFDEFMLLLGDVFAIGKLDKEMEADANKRLDEYRQSFGNVITTLRDDAEFKDLDHYPDLVRSVISRLAGEEMARSWWDWVVEAQKEKDHKKALEVYERARKCLPTSPQLLSSFTLFLSNNYPAHSDAENIGKLAVKLAEDSLGPDHPETVAARNNLGMLFNSKGNYENALPLWQGVLATYERLYGVNHLTVATALANFAQVLHAQSRFKEAEPLMRRALDISEKNLGKNHPDTTIHLNNLAQLLKITNRHKEAEPLMRNALEISEKSFGPDHPHTAIHLNNLATLLMSTNRFKEAEPLMRRALEIDVKSLGPDHPTTAKQLSNLAELLKATNRLKEAAPIILHALEIGEKSFGLDHPNVAIQLNNLGRLLQETKQFKDAEPLMRRALEIIEKHFGPDHPTTASYLGNLGGLLKDTSRFEEAEPLMRRALEITEKSFGPDHPHVAVELNNLGQLLQLTNRIEEAEPLLRRALDITEKSFGSDHPTFAIRLNNLGLLFETTNRIKEAEPLIQRALEIFIKSLGPDHPKTEKVRKNLKRLREKLDGGDESGTPAKPK